MSQQLHIVIIINKRNTIFNQYQNKDFDMLLDDLSFQYEFIDSNIINSLVLQKELILKNGFKLLYHKFKW